MIYNISRIIANLLCFPGITSLGFDPEPRLQLQSLLEVTQILISLEATNPRRLLHIYRERQILH